MLEPKALDSPSSMVTAFTSIASPLGELLVSASSSGLTGVYFPLTGNATPAERTPSALLARSEVKMAIGLCYGIPAHRLRIAWVLYASKKAKSPGASVAEMHESQVPRAVSSGSPKTSDRRHEKIFVTWSEMRTM